MSKKCTVFVVKPVPCAKNLIFQDTSIYEHFRIFGWYSLQGFTLKHCSNLFLGALKQL
jgi:hypothetical protein